MCQAASLARRLGARDGTSGPRAACGASGARAGVTLLELLVVLVVLAVMAGVSGAALGRRLPPRTWRDAGVDTVARARAAAVARGQAVPFTVFTPQGRVRGTALPDGSVLAPPVLAVERLTGRSPRGGAVAAGPTDDAQAGGNRAGQP